jgi:hypothetical protein
VTPTEEKHRTASQSSTSTIVEEPSHMAVDGDRESIKVLHIVKHTRAITNEIIRRISAYDLT